LGDRVSRVDLIGSGNVALAVCASCISMQIDRGPVAKKSRASFLSIMEQLEKSGNLMELESGQLVPMKPTYSAEIQTVLSQSLAWNALPEDVGLTSSQSEYTFR